MKKFLLGLVFVAILLAWGYAVMYAPSDEREEAPVALSHKDATYTIDEKQVKLIGGVAETGAVPGSATKVTTRYFGNQLFKDLNDDGREDVVFLLTQDTGGSGIFYYAVAALNTENGYIGSDGYYVGDRIAPQTTEMSQNPRHTNVVVINYANRNPSEPMTAEPSYGVSAYLKLDTKSMRWGIVEPNFEGEANPDRMTLGMKTWVWQKAEYNDGRTIIPVKSDAFTLTFSDDGRVAVGTDCNSVGGEYSIENDLITFTNMRTTLMYCEGSQETEFMRVLEDAHSFHFTRYGELIFDLKYDSGTVTFR